MILALTLALSVSRIERVQIDYDTASTMQLDNVDAVEQWLLYATQQGPVSHTCHVQVIYKNPAFVDHVQLAADLMTATPFHYDGSHIMVTITDLVHYPGGVPYSAQVDATHDMTDAYTINADQLHGNGDYCAVIVEVPVIYGENVLGVAAVGGYCDHSYNVAYICYPPDSVTALVIAHELAHLYGAFHYDGVGLMNPFIQLSAGYQAFSSVTIGAIQDNFESNGMLCMQSYMNDTVIPTPPHFHEHPDNNDGALAVLYLLFIMLFAAIIFTVV